jgi:DNA-binding winged helix-turn-helix (wHTH) protein
MTDVQFIFDGFVLDVAARELRRGAIPVRLAPKAFDLLKLLVERRPAAVSKADLHALLWPDSFVGDTSLANLASELRAALGDDPRNPRYIRTVHAYGYAFCGRATQSRAAGAPQGFRCWIDWDGRRFPLPDGESLLGRAQDSAIVLEFPDVSRRHARIVVSASEVLLEDLGSRNGTFVRQRRITAPCSLRDGDELGIGPARLVFRLAPPEGTTRVLPPTRGEFS